MAEPAAALEMMSMAYRRWWRVASFSLGVTAAIFSSEAILRITGPTWLGERITPDDDFGHPPFMGDEDWPAVNRDGVWVSYEPGATLHMWNPEYRAVAHIGRWGERVTQAPGTAAPEWIFLGDSQTFGIGVNDDETFAALLSARLHRSIANFGLPGSSLLPQLEQLSLLHAELGGPAVYVFWFYAGNDLSDLIVASSTLDPRSRQRITAAGMYGVFDPFLTRTPLVRTLYVARLGRAAALAWLNEQSFAIVDHFLDVAAPGRETLRAKARATLEHELNSLARMSQQRHFLPVFVIIPDRLQVYPGIRAERAAHYRLTGPIDVEYPNRLLRVALAERRIALIDPLECLRRPGDGLYYRETHLTPAGHRAIAACVADPLIEAVATPAHADPSDTRGAAVIDSFRR